MKNLYRFIFLLLAFPTLETSAQTKAVLNTFSSGNYEEVKISIDSVSNSFTGILQSEMGLFSCTVFFTGKMIKNDAGKYMVTAYPFGLSDGAGYPGTLEFREGKKGHNGSIKLQLSESGSCQNMIDFKQGVFFDFEKMVPYLHFSMIKSKKATSYTNSSEASPKKGYLVQGDFVNIIAEKDGFCNISYAKKPTYKAWIRKSDLIF